MTKATYDEIAAWYNESIQADLFIHDLIPPYLFDLVGSEGIFYIFV